MAQNYSFHAISAAFILAAAPAVYAGFRMLLASGRLDNAQYVLFLLFSPSSCGYFNIFHLQGKIINPLLPLICCRPRQYLEKLQGKIPAETHAELTRARNACANGQEHFPLFVAAVVSRGDCFSWSTLLCDVASHLFHLRYITLNTLLRA